MVVGEGLLGGEQQGYGIGRGELWEHSVTTALAARVIARKLDGEDNLAFTAGLLHDIGKLVLGAFLEGCRAIGAQGNGAVGPFVPRSGEGDSWAWNMRKSADACWRDGISRTTWSAPSGIITTQSKPGRTRQLAAYVHLGDIIAHCLGQAPGLRIFRRAAPRAEALEILANQPEGNRHIDPRNRRGLETNSPA